MKNTNKLLLIILAVLVVATLALISIYLYQKYMISKKGSTGSAVTQGTIIPKATPRGVFSKPVSFPLISNTKLAPAIVGKKYSAVVDVRLNKVNFQITGGLNPGSPEGFQLASCSTVYDAKNSIAKCTITGTPLKSGNFTLKFYINVPTEGGTTVKFLKNIPLTVNP